MYHQLCTGYYHLNTTGFEHEVAHVYEHMLVMTAHRRLAAAGVGNLLAGWVAGETFPRMMFIDYTLYTAQAEQVLAAYMAGRTGLTGTYSTKSCSVFRPKPAAL